MNIEAALRRFQHAFDFPARETPGLVDADVRKLRRRLIVEEVVRELIPAIDNDDLVGIADGIADAVYVLVGAAVTYGIPFNEVFAEVHRTNMAKLWPDGTVHKDEGGKTLKPPGWESPDIEGILRAHGAEL